jgi:hypothetical protein
MEKRSPVRFTHTHQRVGHYLHVAMQNFDLVFSQTSGLRSLGVTFPPHDSSDAGSNPAEVVEFLRTEKFREQVLREGL